MTASRNLTRLRCLGRYHLAGSLTIVLVATLVIADQVEHRSDFANTELVKDVESRWGAPVVQPAPTLRYVESGSIFTELKALAFDQQNVQVDARMNYRRRGLRYFSGFDFSLVGQYSVTNVEGHDIDVAFVFPIEVNKSQVLLSELQFAVDGAPSSLDLGESGDRLVWTGRIRKGARTEFFVRYTARGLDSFVYKLDPSLPVRDLTLHVGVAGGDNYDYPPDVLAASTVTEGRDAVTLDWRYASLESGVNLGVILPSEKTFDTLVATMALRAWLPFLVFMAFVIALGAQHQRLILFYESYLLAAAYGFAFVLVAYLAAFVHFYLAYALAMLGMGAAVVAYLKRLFPEEGTRRLAAAWTACMLVPSGAVILSGYTGLIYTLEILAGLLGLMKLSTHTSVRIFLARFFEGTPGDVSDGNLGFTPATSVPSTSFTPSSPSGSGDR